MAEIELDVWYVEHLSFTLDFKIFLMTIVKIFRQDNIGNGDGDDSVVDDLHFRDRYNASRI